MNPKRLRAYALLLIVSIIWGLAGPVIKNTLSYFPPLVFLSYRFGLSAIIALIFFSFNRSHLPKNASQWSHVLLHGFLTVTLGLSLLFFGFDNTSSLTGSLLAATGPIFVVLFGAWLLKERITKMEAIGLSIAVVGTAVTVIGSNGEALKHELTTGAIILGNGLIVLSRVADALGIVFSKRALNDRIAPIALSNLTFLISFFCILGVTLILYPVSTIIQTISAAPPIAHLGVLYMAFISGSLAYTLFYMGSKSIEIGESSIFSYLTPIWALPVAIFLLHEHVSWQFLAGAILIAIGVFFAEWRRRKRQQKKKKKRI